MARDELRHLEHADLTLAVEYRAERIVGIDLGSLFLVLKAVLFDVVPKLFRELGAWQRRRTDDGRELIIGLHWSHEGGIRFAF